MPSRWSHRRFCRMTATLAACGASLGALPGCQIVGIVGAMAQSAEEMGSTVYPAEYVGLDDHSYAVIISADRVIESDNPGITARLTQIIDRDLKANTQATAHIPAGRLLSKLYADPSWQALPRGELAEKLGVERLVVVEVVEYRLHEPGNRYTWDGVASGVVEVYESDSGLPDDPMFERTIAVTFPDRTGLLEEEVPKEVITSELSRRFGERISWLFYEHEEANAITY
jgi:hypothetical protein